MHCQVGVERLDAASDAVRLRTLCIIRIDKLCGARYHIPMHAPQPRASSNTSGSCHPGRAGVSAAAASVASRAGVLGVVLLLLGCVIGGVGHAQVGGADAFTRTYQPGDALIANPERGLYVQFTARGDWEPLEVATLAALRQQHITLILRLYYLDEFREGPIAADRLALIEADFEAMRRAGVKCILRFAYNEKIGDPDAPIDVVLMHLAQLKPVLTQNADVIAIAQAGFVGSWGEWHASTNDLREPANARQITDAWLEALPSSRVIQLRTPLIKQMIVDSVEPVSSERAFTDTPAGRLGHHNDCFLATDTDMGTYQDIEGEKAYLEKELRYLPMGGETCHVSAFIEADNARAELARFRWSYLNLDYHPEVIDAWRRNGLLAEAERRLGYRLSLESAHAAATIRQGEPWSLELTLKNLGWAPPINPRDVVAVFRGADSAVAWAVPIDVEARKLVAGGAHALRVEAIVPAQLPAGTYGLMLWLPDPAPALRDRPEYAIRLANDGLWDADRGWHDLGIEVSVSDVEAR